MFQLVLILASLVSKPPAVVGYWDIASTTTRLPRAESVPRQAFFRWMTVEFETAWHMFWNPGIDWDENARRRRLCHVAGMSIDLKCLSTATLMNRRVLLTAYNYLDIYMNRMHDLRIWALGRSGLAHTPYRYRVYRVIRVNPKSMNPEHCHGPRCMHTPRDDIAIIWSLDQIYLMDDLPYRWHYAHMARFPNTKYDLLPEDIWFAGSGFEFPEHVRENFEIIHHRLSKDLVVDCSIYLPKSWGKFICLLNRYGLPGIQNGGGFFGGHVLFGICCYETRYNDVRVFMITDVRYYWHVIHKEAYFKPGTYYEYAYPQWGVVSRYMMYEGPGNAPFIPNRGYVVDKYYPFG